MAEFIVRIELHDNATQKEYDDLHREMMSAGFSRTILVNGIEYHLPQAEYRLSGSLDASHVLSKARLVATGISSSASILLSEAAITLTHNLIPAKKAQIRRM